MSLIYGTFPDLPVAESSIRVYDVVEQELNDSFHRHECLEIILITKGTGTWRIGNRWGRFAPGTLGIAKSGTRHFWMGEGPTVQERRVSAILTHIPKAALLEGFLEMVEASQVRWFLNRIGYGAATQLKTYDRIQARMRTLLGARGMLRVARTHALLELIAQLNAWQVIDIEEDNARENASKARLKVVLDHIQNHFRGKISRDDVARLIEMEPSAFSRFFRRVSGQKFSDYLAVIRVRHAAQLLGTRRSLSVAEIARESGFRNLSAFNRQFRKRLGVSPSAYRRNLDLEFVSP